MVAYLKKEKKRKRFMNEFPSFSFRSFRFNVQNFFFYCMAVCSSCMLSIRSEKKLYCAESWQFELKLLREKDFKNFVLNIVYLNLKFNS
jgi:hypothetical protein